MDSKLGVLKVSDLNSNFGGTFSWPGTRKIRLLMAANLSQAKFFEGVKNS